MTKITGPLPVGGIEPVEGVSKVQPIQPAGDALQQPKGDSWTGSIATGGDEIDLRGISADNARKLLESVAFKGWETPYTGDMPGSLKQLQGALGNSANGAPVPEDTIYLQTAGTLIDRATQEASERINPSHLESLAGLRQQALSMRAKPGIDSAHL